MNNYLSSASQTESVEILTPRLTTSLATHLTDKLKDSTHLREVTISNPTQVAQLPHLTSIRLLKITGLSPQCKDWEWMTDAHNLDELDITFEANIKAVQTKFSTNRASSFHVHKTTLEIEIAVEETVTCELFRDILQCLPKSLQKKVSYHFGIVMQVEYS